jgi:hypothetical protein
MGEPFLEFGTALRQRFALLDRDLYLSESLHHRCTAWAVSTFFLEARACKEAVRPYVSM